MIEAQAVIPERKGFHRKWSDTPFIHYRGAQIGAESKILQPFLAMPEEAPDIANFERKAPDNVTQHSKPER